MPIQVDRPKSTSKPVALAALGVLVVIGIVLATNWRAFVLVLVILSAAAGYWMAR